MATFDSSLGLVLNHSHKEYLLLAGRSGGQIAIGGTASGDDLTLQSTAHATRGNIFFGTGGLNTFDEVNSRWGIGIASPTAAFHIDQTDSTITSGSSNSLQSVVRARPPTSSSAAYRGALIQAFTTTGDTVAITGSVVGMSAVAQHLGTFNLTNLYGLQLQGFIGPVFGAPSAATTATTMYGAVFQISSKSTAATAATDFHGGYFSARNNGTGTITRLSGAHIEAGNLDGGSGFGTISTFYSLKVSRRNPAGTNVLSGGTLTNSYMGYIDGFPSGPTYTNTPVQLELEDNDVTAIAIRQQDTAATNQIGGATRIGAVADPSAELHVSTATITNEVFRIESVATNDDPSERVFQARAATTDATVTTLATVTLPASTTVLVEARVIARRTGGTGGTAEDGAGYILSATFQNAAQIGATTVVATHENQAGWDATLDYNANTARVRITGATNNNITWHCTYRTYLTGT